MSQTAAVFLPSLPFPVVQKSRIFEARGAEAQVFKTASHNGAYAALKIVLGRGFRRAYQTDSDSVER